MDSLPILSDGEYKGLNFEHIILQPLNACIDAQKEATTQAYEYFTGELCMKIDENNYSPVMVAFEFINNEKVRMMLKIPLLCLVPIPMVQIENVLFNYTTKVTRYKSSIIRTVRPQDVEKIMKLEGSEDVKIEGEITVKLRAESADLPMGMAQLYQLFGNQYTTDKPLSENDTQGTAIK